MVTVGTFTLENDELWGPADYMNDRGDQLIREIAKGNDAIFNMMWQRSIDEDPQMLVLTRLQNDYAGWIGFQSFIQDQ